MGSALEKQRKRGVPVDARVLAAALIRKQREIHGRRPDRRHRRLMRHLFLKSEFEHESLHVRMFLGNCFDHKSLRICQSPRLFAQESCDRMVLGKSVGT